MTDPQLTFKLSDAWSRDAFWISYRLRPSASASGVLYLTGGTRVTECGDAIINETYHNDALFKKIQIIYSLAPLWKRIKKSYHNVYKLWCLVCLRLIFNISITSIYIFDKFFRNFQERSNLQNFSFASTKVTWCKLDTKICDVIKNGGKKSKQ